MKKSGDKIKEINEENLKKVTYAKKTLERNLEIVKVEKHILQDFFKEIMEKKGNEIQDIERDILSIERMEKDLMELTDPSLINHEVVLKEINTFNSQNLNKLRSLLKDFENNYLNRDVNTVQSSKFICFNKNMVGKFCQLSKNDSRAVFQASGKAITFPTSNVGFNLNSDAGWIMLGLISRSELSLIDVNSYDYSKGYLLYNHGLLYGSSAVSRSYTNILWGKQGDSIRVIYDEKLKTITYYLNEASLGVAFRDVEKTEFYGIVIVAGSADLEIINNEPKEYKIKECKHQ